MEVTINGQTLQFRMDNWWGPMYAFEEVMDVEHYPERRFNPAKTLHLHIMLWCVLMTDNPDSTLQLEDFLKALDDMELYRVLLEHYNRRVSILLDMPAQDGDPSKKKN